MPAACCLYMSLVIQTLSYVLDTSGNMAAVYASLLKCSVTHSVEHSSCSVTYHPDKKAISQEFNILHKPVRSISWWIEDEFRLRVLYQSCVSKGIRTRDIGL
jgi:hypothetical protein